MQCRVIIAATLGSVHLLGTVKLSSRKCLHFMLLSYGVLCCATTLFDSILKYSLLIVVSVQLMISPFTIKVKMIQNLYIRISHIPWHPRMSGLHCHPNLVLNNTCYVNTHLYFEGERERVRVRAQRLALATVPLSVVVGICYFQIKIYQGVSSVHIALWGFNIQNLSVKKILYGHSQECHNCVS